MIRISKITGIIFILLLNIKNINGQEMTIPQFNEIDNYLTKSVDVSEDYFNSLLALYPSNDYLLGMNIYMNYSSGDRKKLENHFYKELSVNNTLNNSSFVELAKGIIEFNKENKEEALKHYLRSLEIDNLSKKNNKWVRYELYFNYKEEDLNTSIKYLNEALTIDSNFTPALYELAFIHRGNGELNQAIKIFDDILKRGKDDYAKYNKAFFLEEMEEYSKAEKIYEELIKDSKYLEAYIGLGMIAQYRHQDYKKAEECFMEVLKINAIHDEAYQRLFRLYVEMETMEKAHEAIVKAYELNSNQINLIDLIYAKTLLKKYGESKGLIEHYYSKFESGYEIDFWDILITTLHEKKEAGQEKINKFYDNYTSAEVNYLKSELAAWNININRTK